MMKNDLFSSTGAVQIIGYISEKCGRAFLCLLPEEHVCDALGSSGFIFLDDVGIEVLRGVYAGMAQLLRWDTTFSGAVYPICHVPKLLLILDSFCWIENGHRLTALVLIVQGQRRSLGKQSGKRKHPLTLAAGIALQQRHLDAFALLGRRSKGTLFHYKDIKKLVADLKKIYTAVTLQEAEENLRTFSNEWRKQYPSCAKSWEENWEVLSTFFEYPPEIRKIIYTTNIIEGLNRQFRQITKNKPSFTNDDSLRRMLYLASQRIVKHWHARCQNWDMVLSQLEIMFADRKAG